MGDIIYFVTWTKCLLLFSLWLLSLLLVSCSSSVMMGVGGFEEPKELNNWEFIWGDIGDPSRASGADWKAMEEFPGVPPGRDSETWLWLRVALNEIPSPDPGVWFGRTFSSYQVFLEEKLIGEYAFKNGRPDPYFPGFRWQLFPIPSNSSSGYLYIRCYSEIYYIGPQFPVLIGDRYNLLSRDILMELVPTSLSLAILLVGIILLVIAFKTREITGMKQFAFILICVGAYTFRYQDLRFYVINNAMFWDLYGLFLTFILPFHFGLLIDQFFNKIRYRMLKLNVLVSKFLTIGILVMILCFIFIRVFHLMPDIFNLLILSRKILQVHILLTITVIMIHLLKSLRAGDKRAGVFLVAIGIFALSALPSIISAMGYFVSHLNPILYLGLIGLLVVFGTSLYKNYLFLRQEHAATVKELQNFRRENEQLKERIEEPGKISPVLIKKYGITNRELEIIENSLLGMRNRQIAQALGISERTVKSHITNIFNKTNVSNKLELMHNLKN